MPILPCEYEILLPRNPPKKTASVEADPNRLLHPDPIIAARAVTELRKFSPRRFAFYTIVTGYSDVPMLSTTHYGYEYSDGSVVITTHEGPRGWYRSVSSAWRRLRFRDEPMWLAWLEPETVDAHHAATWESSHREPSRWYLSIPFAAFGPHDARMRAANIAVQLETSVPGLDRLDVTCGPADDPETEQHVFCNEQGCLKAPDHTGDHLFADAEGLPDTALEPDAAATEADTPADSEATDNPSDADEPPSEADPR